MFTRGKRRAMEKALECLNAFVDAQANLAHATRAIDDSQWHTVVETVARTNRPVVAIVTLPLLRNLYRMCTMLTHKDLLVLVEYARNLVADAEAEMPAE